MSRRDADPDDRNWRHRGRELIEWMVDASPAQRIAVSLAALVAAILVGGLLVLFSGLAADCIQPFVTVPGVGEFCYNPVEVYWTLLVGAFGSWRNLGLTLQETTLLLFTGLSVAVAFRAGLFNIGTQGQMVLGALATALVVIGLGGYVPAGIAGGLLLVPLGIVAGAAVGGVYGMIPGALKAYADANEVITTIMLNFIAAGSAFYLVSAYFDDPGSQAVQTVAMPSFARLPPTIGGTRFSMIALLGALAVAVGIYLLYDRTVLGYDLRTSGVQPEAAEYSGVDAERNVVTSMTLSGALGGVAGALYVLMILYRWQSGFPPLGFDGIAVSILAGNHPLGVVPAALLFGALKSGSLQIDFALGVPNELVEVLRGLIILFVAMPEFFRMLGVRWGLGAESERVAADGGDEDGDGGETDV